MESCCEETHITITYRKGRDKILHYSGKDKIVSQNANTYIVIYSRKGFHPPWFVRITMMRCAVFLTWDAQVISSSEICFEAPACRRGVCDEKHSHSVGGGEHVLHRARPCVHSCPQGKRDCEVFESQTYLKNFISIFYWKD